MEAYITVDVCMQVPIHMHGDGMVIPTSLIRLCVLACLVTLCLAAVPVCMARAITTAAACECRPLLYLVAHACIHVHTHTAMCGSLDVC